jgi:tetratricopeptide (TPR) repeat protein
LMPLPDTPKIPIQTSFDLQIEGVSIGQVVRAWDYLRYQQENVSGDIILEKDGEITIRVRAVKGSTAKYWEEQGVRTDRESLANEIDALAVLMFSDLHPYALGRHYLKIGELKKAQQVFAESLRTSSKSSTRVPASFWLAYTYLFMGDREQAQFFFKQALDADPDYFPALGLLAFLELRDDRGLPDARAQFADAVELNKRALSLAVPWWQFWKPKPPNYYLNIGSSLLSQGKPKEALPWLDRALAADPDFSSAEYDIGLANERIAEKAAAGKERETYLEQGIRHYELALRKNPGNMDALHSLRLLLTKSRGETGKHEAEEECRRHIALNPGAEEPLYELAEVLNDEGNHSGAEEYYHLAIFAPRHSGSRLVSQGMALSGRNWALAQAFFRAAVESYSSSLEKNAESPAFWMEYGDALYWIGAIDIAGEAYQTASRLRPPLMDAPNFHLRLVDLAHEGKRYRDVLNESDQAIKLNPEFANNRILQIDRAEAFATVGDYPNAVLCFEKAEQLGAEQKQPLNGSFYWNFGNLLRVLGENTKAEQKYQAAVIVDPHLEADVDFQKDRGMVAKNSPRDHDVVKRASRLQYLQSVRKRNSELPSLPLQH